MFKIRFTKRAEADLEAIKIYIGNNEYSELVVNLLLKSISLLTYFPEMGIEISEDEREIVESKYKYQIRYAIIGQEIYILLIYKFNNIVGR